MAISLAPETSTNRPRRPRAAVAPQSQPSAPLSLTPTTPVPAATPQTAPTVPQNGAVQSPDRLELANKAITTSAAATDPYYQKSLKDATSQAASVGQLGSGQLRTSLGDLARNRALELDTLRSNAITSATNASVDDAFRSRDQGLAAGQLELSKQLGTGNLDIAKEQADTSRIGTTGNLELGKTGQALSAKEQAESSAARTAQLELAKTGQQTAQDLQKAQLTGELNGQQTLGARAQTLAETSTLANLGQAERQTALAERAQQAQEAYQKQEITLAEKDQILKELQNAQSNTLATQQFALSKQLGLEGLSLDQARQSLSEKVAANQITQAQASQALAEKEQQEASGARGTQLELANKAQSLTEKLGLANLSLEQAKQALAEKVANGQLTLAEQAQALNEIQAADANRVNQGNLELARYKQSVDTIRSGQSLDIQHEQIANQAAQFGATQAQQLELAKLADATNNKQIDASTEQGRKQLLVQIGNIVGGPNGNVNPKLLAVILESLGVATGGSGLYGDTPTYNAGGGDANVDPLDPNLGGGDPDRYRNGNPP